MSIEKLLEEIGCKDGSKRWRAAVELAERFAGSENERAVDMLIEKAETDTYEEYASGYTIKVGPPYLQAAAKIGGEKAKQYIFGLVKEGDSYLDVNLDVRDLIYILSDRYQNEVVEFLLQQVENGTEKGREIALGCIGKGRLVVRKKAYEYAKRCEDEDVKKNIKSALYGCYVKENKNVIEIEDTRYFVCKIDSFTDMWTGIVWQNRKWIDCVFHDFEEHGTFWNNGFNQGYESLTNYLMTIALVVDVGLQQIYPVGLTNAKKVVVKVGKKLKEKVIQTTRIGDFYTSVIKDTRYKLPGGKIIQLRGQRYNSRYESLSSVNRKK